MKRINLRVPDEVYDQLTVLAEVKGTTLQDVTLELVQSGIGGANIQQLAEARIQRIREAAGLTED